MAAGLRPDPLGELERSPRPLAAMRGPTSKGKGEERGEGGKGTDSREGEGEEGKGRRERGGERRERGEGGRDSPPPQADRLDPPLSCRGGQIPQVVFKFILNKRPLPGSEAYTS